LLDGNVTAKSISVEKGGVFMGELTIGTAGLAQGELLPESAPAAAASEEIAPGAVSHPLPAT
jgi:cytoskeletal protein CcmA (bactofilin family)